MRVQKIGGYTNQSSANKNQKQNQTNFGTRFEDLEKFKDPILEIISESIAAQKFSRKNDEALPAKLIEKRAIEIFNKILDKVGDFNFFVAVRRRFNSSLDKLFELISLLTRSKSALQKEFVPKEDLDVDKLKGADSCIKVRPNDFIYNEDFLGSLRKAVFNILVAVSQFKNDPKPIKLEVAAKELDDQIFKTFTGAIKELLDTSSYTELEKMAMWKDGQGSRFLKEPKK